VSPSGRLDSPVDLVQGAAGLHQEGPARVGELNAAVGPDEQADPELALQVQDLPAQPRLGEVDGDRGLPGNRVRSLLVVDDLAAGYGQIPALKGVSLRVDQGEIVTLIGPNGAGKTTLLRTLIGLHPASRGRVQLLGRDISGLRVHQRVALGLTLVPEGRGILPDMSVRESLLMGAYARQDRGACQGDLDRVYARFPVLRERER
jgi:ABC-type transport system involved in cytochrome bd biosynthesis fused ATPase/permease subunit